MYRTNRIRRTDALVGALLFVMLILSIMCIPVEYAAGLRVTLRVLLDFGISLGFRQTALSPRICRGT
jgi:hypothetical protein